MSSREKSDWFPGLSEKHRQDLRKIFKEGHDEMLESLAKDANKPRIVRFALHLRDEISFSLDQLRRRFP